MTDLCRVADWCEDMAYMANKADRLTAALLSSCSHSPQQRQLIAALERIATYCRAECGELMILLADCSAEEEDVAAVLIDDEPAVCNGDWTDLSLTSKGVPPDVVLTGRKRIKRNFICPTCQRNCFTTARLERHLRTHSGVKPFVCDVCGAAYQQNNDLVRHRRKHAGSAEEKEPRLTCPLPDCNRSFVSANSLNMHLRIHSGEKPFLCLTCGKSFRTSSACRRHNLVHTGERPFSCQYCSKAFQTSSALSQHTKTHQRLEDSGGNEEGPEAKNEEEAVSVALPLFHQDDEPGSELERTLYL